ncbi:MAG: response regulator [Nostoc sp. ChiSLP02]|nr:response regulator [Nostoc sp. DedSLP05]MDZ8099614.1 response regulator [Nostoc sp. DedSLP01]MDZ8186130.1 response regulator [Nostoc sp. ChiSLP02]
MYLAHSFTIDDEKQTCHQPLILVVEDRDDSLLVISYALEAIGCRFICQKDCTATVLVAKEYQPDLILLDILLPGMSGIDVARHLKQETLTRTIPVVAVTALATPEAREEILEAGFDDYISKPYMLEDLEAMISRLLKGKFDLQSAFELC